MEDIPGRYPRKQPRRSIPNGPAATNVSPGLSRTVGDDVCECATDSTPIRTALFGEVSPERRDALARWMNCGQAVTRLLIEEREPTPSHADLHYLAHPAKIGNW